MRNSRPCASCSCTAQMYQSLGHHDDCSSTTVYGCHLAHSAGQKGTFRTPTSSSPLCVLCKHLPHLSSNKISQVQQRGAGGEHMRCRLLRSKRCRKWHHADPPTRSIGHSPSWGHGAMMCTPVANSSSFSTLACSSQTATLPSRGATGPMPTLPSACRSCASGRSIVAASCPLSNTRTASLETSKACRLESASCSAARALMSWPCGCRFSHGSTFTALLHMPRLPPNNHCFVCTACRA
jgi:hypothetical protein